ncbi:LysR substrate-binding domain-containing protein [Pelomonas sp. SE-A7]|uniref:LysR substrate-binding domain-containing protein n=1 Tax=Pelomonas sp. SE-A7 TaxID=3054953 RepID=UPI00259D15BA|nr:LysR substrate-binding domain-containing protein [Pelomonas sp. SE-A7]MDM4764592.1 LysR substrate-binding domain-containing protein [Pelomonas sp. SE-A7]
MIRLPLQYLAAFRAAAQAENLRAAAEKLFLTHSAVSQQIRALETQLGFELFERQGRRIRLNAAGHTLLAGVERAYAELEQSLQAAAAMHGQAQRSLRVTVLPSFAQRWLMPRLGRWSARHPEIALELHASQQLVDLEREGFHLALRQGRGPWTGMVNEALFESPFLPVAAPGLAHRLIGAPPAQLAGEMLLGDAALWMSWFEAAGSPQRVTPVASFNDAGLLLQAAEQGMGIALCRELLAADALLDGRLVRLSAPCMLDNEQRSYHLVYPPALRDDPALRAFCDWLKSEIAQSRAALSGSPARETAPADR